MNEFNEYQVTTADFVLPSVALNPYYFTMGLAGEVGEVAELIKKNLRDGKEVSSYYLTKELGDVLFYLTQIATTYGISLEDVAQANVDKLESRKSRGVIGGSGNDR